MIVQRASAVIGTTVTPGWAAELVQNAWGEYLASLTPFSGAARLIQLAVPVVGHRFDEILFPVRAAGAQPPGFVGEGEPIPVRGDVFSLVTLGPLRKMASIVAWSREVGKRSDAEQIFRLMLAEDVSAGLDAAFFSDAAADAVRPAGLLFGVAPITAAAGADEAAIRTDLAVLAEAVSATGSGSVTFIAAPARVAKLRILAPTLFPVLDIVASASIAADRIIAADGASLLVSVDPSPDVTVSNVATVHMDTAPAPIVDGATASPVRELWQTASLAARLIHELSFVKRRAGAVAYIDAASW